MRPLRAVTRIIKIPRLIKVASHVTLDMPPMNQKEFTRILAFENAIKNSLAFFISIATYPWMRRILSTLADSALSDFLFIISILLVTVCFAAFAFTYDKSRMATRSGRIFAHTTTFIFMLLIATLLESMAISVHLVYPSLTPLIVPFTILLYVGLAMYDFWDLLRVETTP